MSNPLDQFRPNGVRYRELAIPGFYAEVEYQEPHLWVTVDQGKGGTRLIEALVRDEVMGSEVIAWLRDTADAVIAKDSSLFSNPPAGVMNWKIEWEPT